MSKLFPFPFVHKHQRRLDLLGAMLSFACALHCALQPLLLMALPVMGLGGLLDERVESYFLAGSLVLASVLVVSGSRHHGQKQAWPILALGAAAIVASRLPWFESWEMPLAVMGALGITSAHALNLRLHRRHHAQTHLHSVLPAPAEDDLPLKRSAQTGCLV
ncbi:MAG: MerC domain-containing protein [Candidatus Sericytochromatia bacterium]